MQGHQEVACRQIPNWLQPVKKTRHPMVVALYVTAIHVTSSALAKPDKNAITTGLTSLLASLSDLDSTYCKAAAGEVRILNEELAQTSKECMAMLKHPSLTQDFDEARNWTANLLQDEERKPDVVAMADTYSRLSRVTKQTMDEAATKGRLEMRQTFEEESLRLKELSAAEASQLAAKFKGIVSQAEKHFDVLVEKNADGVPTLFWPGASWKDIFVLAHKAFTRALLECDLIVAILCLWTWEGDSWWVVIVV